MKLKRFVSILLSAVLVFAAGIPAYAADECRFHVDEDYNMACDICSVSAFSGEDGVNSTAIIIDDIVYFYVYFTGMRSYTRMFTSFHYDERFLAPLGGYFLDDYYVAPRTQEIVLEEGGWVYASAVAPSGVNIPYDNPFFFVYAFEILTDYIDTTILGESVLDTDAKMDNGGMCMFNSILYMDGTHEHIDNDIDMQCDLCRTTVFYLGDMNCDGRITAADARIALRIAAKLEPADEYSLFVGDLNEDGRITADEARKILRVAAGIDTFEDL